MIALLLIGSQPIPLLNQASVTDLRGYANVQYWSDGVFIYAHNYLTGQEFYNLPELSIIHVDGTLTRYEEKQTAILTDPTEWPQLITAMSSPETITLATCWPPNGTGQWYIVEMQRIEEQ